MRIIYNFCGGCSKFFALVILAIGTALAILHKLDGSFVALAGAVHTFVVIRAVAEDHAPQQAIAPQPPK